MHCVMKNSKGCLKHCTSTVVVHYLINKLDHPPQYHAATYCIAGYFQIFVKSRKRSSELNFVVLTLNSTHDTRNRMHSQTLAVCIHLRSHFSVQRELKSTLVASDLCKALTFHWHFPLKSLVSWKCQQVLFHSKLCMHFATLLCCIMISAMYCAIVC